MQHYNVDWFIVPLKHRGVAFIVALTVIRKIKPKMLFKFNFLLFKGILLVSEDAVENESRP